MLKTKNAFFEIKEEEKIFEESLKIRCFDYLFKKKI